MVDTALLIILLLICVLVFLFSFWRNLKDDYLPSQIFSLAFNVFLSAALGFYVWRYVGNLAFWVVILSLLLGYIIGSIRSRIKIYDGLDGAVISILISVLFSSLLLFKFRSSQLVLFYGMIAAGIIIYSLVKKNYKSFVWYKSGRRGFSGLFVIGVFFLTRSIVSIVKPELTYYLYEYDIIISGLISFMSFLNIFILGGK